MKTKYYGIENPSLFSEDSEYEKKQEAKEFVVSGYRIYAPKQQQKIKYNDLPELYPDLPDEKYDIIYADPPWDYGGKMQFDKSSIKNENKNWERDIFISAANFKYPTVKTKDLKKRKLQRSAAKSKPGAELLIRVTVFGLCLTIPTLCRRNGSQTMPLPPKNSSPSWNLKRWSLSP